MAAPSYLESHISQIPALQLLQKLGFSYLTPEEVAVERRGKLRFVILEDILTKQLHRLNRFSVRGHEHRFSDESIAKAIETMREPLFDGLVRTSEKIYDLLTLGESFEQNVDGETRSPQLRYIDWENPHNNVFHVTAEFEVERSGSKKTRRPDIVCFVNGIPFVVIECKRPDEKHSLDAAIKQNLRNQESEEIPQLYLYSQLTVGINKNEGSYGTTGTPIKFWSKWREMGDISEQVDQLVNESPGKDAHEKLFSGMFAFAKEEVEKRAVEKITPTEQDDFLYALCRPERLIELARQFILYDEGGAVKKIARYQQYFAVKRTLERVRQRTPEGSRKGGVIWHTQGSGKSLTMVLFGKALALDDGIENPRIVIVTDRIDLDEQIWKTFHQCGKNPQQAKTGKHLVKLLKSDKADVITTIIDKFNAASKTGSFVNEDDNLFVLVDESHRSQYGEANTRMLKSLPNACFIGFTGTPLMKKDKNTAEKFGGFIDPAYTIRDAVEDKAVVPLFYEGRHVMQDVNKKGIDTMFESLAEGLSPEQKADLKRKFSGRDELNRLDSRLYLIAWDISQHYSKEWKGTGFKAQLTAPGKKEAIRLKRLLDDFGKVNAEVIISAPDDREGDDKSKADETVLRFWKGMMDKYGSEKEYNRNIIESFKKGDDPEIIIVVDKLLTGFDAPRNRILYIARNLKEHNLLQAIARVNRLHDGKDNGLIIDYYGVLAELYGALELYSALGKKFDKEDLEGTLINLSEELKKLPDQHAAVWKFFDEVANKEDVEAFELALEDDTNRDAFYTALSHFNRTLKLALSSIHWIKETPEAEIDRYKESAKFFYRLRASVKIRYAEEIDYREYEAQIEKMLNNFVQADEIVQVVDPVNIFEREAFEAEVDRLKSPRAKADAIANRTKKTITERMDEDPFFYRKLSVLIEQAIEDYKNERINESEYLSRVTDCMEQARKGRNEDGPEALRERDLARALFGSLKEQLAGSLQVGGEKTGEDSNKVGEPDSPSYGTDSKQKATPETILAEAACHVEDIIRKHSIIGWRENVDAQNRMRNEIDDYLFALQGEHGIGLSFDQMDSFIESAISIARNRTQDV
ncbi:type I restriction endonuclease subunit R [Verrucomicrobiales bacterium BCK34]|nr:type I restriction endonuclease subunit R [Verrucomicrobiales bacterium BCK34]